MLTYDCVHCLAAHAPLREPGEDGLLARADLHPACWLPHRSSAFRDDVRCRDAPRLAHKVVAVVEPDERSTATLSGRTSGRYFCDPSHG